MSRQIVEPFILVSILKTTNKYILQLIIFSIYYDILLFSYLLAPLLGHIQSVKSTNEQPAPGKCCHKCDIFVVIKLRIIWKDISFILSLFLHPINQVLHGRRLELKSQHLITHNTRIQCNSRIFYDFYLKPHKQICDKKSQMMFVYIYGISDISIE